MKRKAEIGIKTGKGGRFIIKEKDKLKTKPRNTRNRKAMGGYLGGQIKRKRAISMIQTGTAGQRNKLSKRSPKRRATRLDIKKLGSPGKKYFRKVPEQSAFKGNSQSNRKERGKQTGPHAVGSEVRPRNKSKFTENILGMGEFDRRVDMSSLEKRKDNEIQKIKKGLSMLKRKSKIKKMRRRSKVAVEVSEKKIEELKDIFNGMARESLDRREYDKQLQDHRQRQHQQQQKSRPPRRSSSKETPALPSQQRSKWNKVRESSQGPRSRSPRDSSYAALAHRRQVMREDNRSKDKPYQSNVDQVRLERGNSKGSFKVIQQDLRKNMMDAEYPPKTQNTMGVNSRAEYPKKPEPVEILGNLDRLRKDRAQRRSRSRVRSGSRASRDKSPFIVSEEMRGVKHIIRQQLSQPQGDSEYQSEKRKRKRGREGKTGAKKSEQKSYRNRYTPKFLNE